MRSHDHPDPGLISDGLGDLVWVLAARGRRHRLCHAGREKDDLCAPPDHLRCRPHGITARASSAVGYAYDLHILIRVLLELAALLTDGLKAARSRTRIHSPFAPDNAYLHHDSTLCALDI